MLAESHKASNCSVLFDDQGALRAPLDLYGHWAMTQSSSWLKCNHSSNCFKDIECSKS